MEVIGRSRTNYFSFFVKEKYLVTQTKRPFGGFKEAFKNVYFLVS